MLQKIRDNTQGLLAKLFIGFIIAVFALFGVDTIVGTFLTSTATLSVNGTDISEFEIESLTQSKAQEFYANIPEGTDLSAVDEQSFRNSAIDELIQRELLVQSADRTGMTMSSVTLDRRIATNPDFQVDGVFNAERAALLLQNIGYSPASYRAALAREGVINQILMGYSGSGFATRAELARLTALTHQKRSFRYVELGIENQMQGTEVTPEEISAYYEANQDDFIREEQVKIEYLELDRTALQNEVSITEEQIRTRYDEELASFQAQTERRASHILFEASTEEEFVAAQAEAETVKARLDAGEDFAALAAEFSDDTGSADAGGDVGYTTGSNFVEGFETALQALEVGAVSPPVRTEFGVHLIKLTEISDTAAPTFEERRGALEADLRSAAANDLFIARSEELSNLAFESPDLDGPAEAMGLQKQTSDWFGRSGGLGIAAFPNVANAAFSAEVLEERLNSDLLQVDASRSVVIRVVDHQLPAARPLEEVSAEIDVLLRLEKAKEQVRLIGETILSSVQAGDNIDGLLAAQNIAWTQMDAVERSAPGLNPEISDKVFTMARPAEGDTEVAGFQLAGGQYIVVELQNVTDGTEADLRDNEAQNMRNFVSQAGAAHDVASFLTSLEARAEIEGRTPSGQEPEDFQE